MLIIITVFYINYYLFRAFLHYLIILSLWGLIIFDIERYCVLKLSSPYSKDKARKWCSRYLVSGLKIVTVIISINFASVYSKGNACELICKDEWYVNLLLIVYSVTMAIGMSGPLIILPCISILLTAQMYVIQKRSGILQSSWKGAVQERIDIKISKGLILLSIYTQFCLLLMNSQIIYGMWLTRYDYTFVKSKIQ